MPYFSIVIPTFNRAALIATTINTVLKQDFNDFEIIIIDDGSTDNTETLLCHILTDKKIIYYKQENKERGAARNQGIKMAAGKYVLFLDSDDLLNPNHLSALIQIIDLHPEANFLCTKYDLERNGKKELSSVSPLKQGWYDSSLLLKGNPFAANICIKKKMPT